MKKTILFVALSAFTLLSCKKDDDPVAPGCETTVAGIAANYKITKIELGSTTVTDDILDACQKGGLYQFKCNGTYLYTEAGSSCTDSGDGIWSVANNKISIIGNGYEVIDAPINSWDCTTLVMTEDFGGSSLKITLTKQ